MFTLLFTCPSTWQVTLPPVKKACQSNLTSLVFGVDVMVFAPYVLPSPSEPIEGGSSPRHDVKQHTVHETTPWSASEGAILFHYLWLWVWSKLLLQLWGDANCARPFWITRRIPVENKPSFLRLQKRHDLWWMKMLTDSGSLEIFACVKSNQATHQPIRTRSKWTIGVKTV